MPLDGFSIAGSASRSARGPALATKRILVIGYGNPGRGDDGLGPALAARLEAMHLPDVTVESDYQLSVEHAAMAAENDVVVFVDAALDAVEAFYFRSLTAAHLLPKFMSHGISPTEVLHLAGSCFQSYPAGYLLGIHAQYMDDFREGLTSGAERSLEQALEHLRGFIAAARQ
jgi:hydrogenase maturation protease